MKNRKIDIFSAEMPEWKLFLLVAGAISLAVVIAAGLTVLYYLAVRERSAGSLSALIPVVIVLGGGVLLAVLRRRLRRNRDPFSD